MKLSSSFAHRGAYDCKTVHVYASSETPPTGFADSGLEFRFDMGTSSRRETIALFIHNTDFETIAVLMAEADRDNAIQAFAKAMLNVKR